MKKAAVLISETLQISIAIVLSSIGLKAFLLPNGFLDGGVTGIAILLSQLIQIDISIILTAVSIPFFIVGWFTISRRVLIKSIISVLILAAAIHFEHFEAITEDKLLISVFGGLFLGAGIGLAIKNGAVLDGSEILGVYINEKTGLSIGTIFLWFNVVLFALAGLLFPLETAMYSVLTYLVTAKTIDLVLKGFEDYIGLMIVSAKSDEMQKQLLEKVGQGLTIYQGKKGYGSQGVQSNFDIIHTVINRIDSKKAYKTVQKVDQNAFVIEFDVNNVKGGVLRKYLTSKKQKELATTISLNDQEKRAQILEE
ncbi:MAG: YitT family protein [Crocinitomicaceae bacterium]